MELVRTINATVTGDYSDGVQVWQDFLTVVNGLPGVTVINSMKHEFPGGGISGLVLIAESHAAIHTWPEHDKAWIELATCGDPAALDVFVQRWVDVTGGTPELLHT